MLKLLATDGPMSSVTKPINDAVEWVTGTGKKENTAADGGDADAEKEGDAPHGSLARAG